MSYYDLRFDAARLLRDRVKADHATTDRDHGSIVLVRNVEIDNTSRLGEQVAAWIDHVSDAAIDALHEVFGVAYELDDSASVGVPGRPDRRVIVVALAPVEEPSEG